MPGWIDITASMSGTRRGAVRALEVCSELDDRDGRVVRASREGEPSFGKTWTAEGSNRSLYAWVICDSEAPSRTTRAIHLAAWAHAPHVRLSRTQVATDTGTSGHGACSDETSELHVRRSRGVIGLVSTPGRTTSFTSTAALAVVLGVPVDSAPPAVDPLQPAPHATAKPSRTAGRAAPRMALGMCVDREAGRTAAPTCSVFLPGLPPRLLELAYPRPQDLHARRVDQVGRDRRHLRDAVATGGAPRDHAELGISGLDAEDASGIEPARRERARHAVRGEPRVGRGRGRREKRPWGPRKSFM